MFCIAIVPFNVVAGELPAGVPRTIWPDGTTTVDPMFTTQAYQKKAFRLVLQEANQVAKEMKLPEKLPITESNVVHTFISAFGFAYTYKAIGNVTTSNYWYGVEHGNKFSGLTIVDLDRHCFKYQEQYQWPVSRIDTNGAYQLATQWLAAMRMDVKALNRDCKVKITIDAFWNGLKPGEELQKNTFVPIYNISWLSSNNQAENYGDVAYVQLFAPTKTLLQFAINNPKYILRKPVVFRNLATLFPGRALIKTNATVKTIIAPHPPPP